MTILSEKHDVPQPPLSQELLKHLSISRFKLLTHHLFPHSTTWVLKLLSGHDALLGKPPVASHCRLESTFPGLRYSFYKSRRKESLMLFSTPVGPQHKRNCTFPGHARASCSSPLLLLLILPCQMFHLPPIHFFTFFCVLQSPASMPLTAYYFPWLMTPWGCIVLSPEIYTHHVSRTIRTDSFW